MIFKFLIFILAKKKLYYLTNIENIIYFTFYKGHKIGL